MSWLLGGSRKKRRTKRTKSTKRWKKSLRKRRGGVLSLQEKQDAILKKAKDRAEELATKDEEKKLKAEAKKEVTKQRAAEKKAATALVSQRRNLVRKSTTEQFNELEDQCIRACKAKYKSKIGRQRSF